MLIEFRVENHKSLRDEQVITLEAGRVGGSSDSRPREVAGHRGKLLPAAVIYGANASGKSNLLAAFAFMRESVIVSHRHWEPESGIPRTPFAWGNSKSSPSMFEVTVLVERTRYAYGFSVDDNAVCEEWLFSWPNNRKQVWFERDGMHFKFGEHMKGPNETVREVTRNNALFLSAGAQHGHEALTRLYSWFRRSLPTCARTVVPSCTPEDSRTCSFSPTKHNPRFSHSLIRMNHSQIACDDYSERQMLASLT